MSERFIEKNDGGVITLECKVCDRLVAAFGYLVEEETIEKEKKEHIRVCLEDILEDKEEQ